MVDVFSDTIEARDWVKAAALECVDGVEDPPLMPCIIKSPRAALPVDAALVALSLEVGAKGLFELLVTVVFESAPSNISDGLRWSLPIEGYLHGEATTSAAPKTAHTTATESAWLFHRAMLYD